MIPFFDYRPEYHRQRDEIDDAVRRVLESGQWILGPELEAFEREFAGFVGSAYAGGKASDVLPVTADAVDRVATAVRNAA